MDKITAAIVATILIGTSFLNLTERAQEITAGYTMYDVIRLSLTPTVSFFIGVAILAYALVEIAFPSEVFDTMREDSEDSRII